MPTHVAQFHYTAGEFPRGQVRTCLSLLSTPWQSLANTLGLWMHSAQRISYRDRSAVPSARHSNAEVCAGLPRRASQARPGARVPSGGRCRDSARMQRLPRGVCSSHRVI